MLIKWDQSMSVNVEEIDLQHQKLFNIINELFEAMTEGKGKSVLGKILRELVNYTGIHFKTEEMYFEKFGYPGAKSHKKQHAEFIDKLASFEKGLERGQLGLPTEVFNYLCDWQKNHIKTIDKKYSQFFNDNGLK